MAEEFKTEEQKEKERRFWASYIDKLMPEKELNEWWETLTHKQKQDLKLHYDNYLRHNR